jgi:hypothetical protein
MMEVCRKSYLIYQNTFLLVNSTSLHWLRKNSGRENQGPAGRFLIFLIITLRHSSRASLYITRRALIRFWLLSIGALELEGITKISELLMAIALKWLFSISFNCNWFSFSWLIVANLMFFLSQKNHVTLIYPEVKKILFLPTAIGFPKKHLNKSKKNWW